MFREDVVLEKQKDSSKAHTAFRRYDFEGLFEGFTRLSYQARLQSLKLANESVRIYMYFVGSV